MKGTIQKWKFMILLGALLFLSNMTFAEDKINHYAEGNPYRHNRSFHFRQNQHPPTGFM